MHAQYTPSLTDIPLNTVGQSFLAFEGHFPEGTQTILYLVPYLVKNFDAFLDFLQSPVYLLLKLSVCPHGASATRCKPER